MHGGEVLIPIIMFAGAFAMIFGIVYLRTRQNLAMIEKGMNPKEKISISNIYKSYNIGLLHIVGMHMNLHCGLRIILDIIFTREKFSFIPMKEHSFIDT